jgi:hypothetical protein
MSRISQFGPSSTPDAQNRPREASAPAAPNLSAISFGVFIKCREYGTQNCFDVPPVRMELVRFRGLDDPIKCKGCHADIDSMLAYCGERIGSEIVRHEDPRY